MSEYKSRFNEKVDVNYRLKFITERPQLVEDYLLREVYYRVVQEQFQLDFPDYYLEKNSFKFEVTALDFSIDVDTPYDEIKKEFTAHTESSDLSPLEQKEKAYFQFSLGRNSGVWGWNGKDTFDTVQNMSVNRVFFLLDYVLNKTFRKDYAKVNEVEDDIWNGVKDEKGLNWLPDNERNFRNISHPYFHGLTFSYLKNRKFIIKGLKRQEAEEIIRLINLVRET